jgi:regulator of nucleoside diphosphate kinase
MHRDDDRIVITATDHQRLERLLETSAGRRDAPHLDALADELARATIVPPDEVPADVATMNSALELVDLDSGEELALTLVYPPAADARAQKVSVLAPAGVALLGSRRGDEVSWASARRARRVRLVRVSYQPEASGRFDL